MCCPVSVGLWLESRGPIVLHSVPNTNKRVSIIILNVCEVASTCQDNGCSELRKDESDFQASQKTRVRCELTRTFTEKSPNGKRTENKYINFLLKIHPFKAVLEKLNVFVIKSCLLVIEQTNELKQYGLFSLRPTIFVGLTLIYCQNVPFSRQ